MNTLLMKGLAQANLYGTGDISIIFFRDISQIENIWGNNLRCELQNFYRWEKTLRSFYKRGFMFKDVLENEEERIKLIRDMLKTLTKREEMILRYYYGIENRRGTLTEIGQDFDITQNTVRRIKNKGVLKMVHRVTKYEPFIFYFSSDVDKDFEGATSQ